MINGAFNLSPGSGYFRFQGSNAGLEFRHRQWPQILLQQAGYRIISLSRQIVIQVHDSNVDPEGHSVNKGGDDGARF